MQVSVWRVLVGALFFVMLSACGELRFSQVAPDAGAFHPVRICVLPVDPGAYKKEAKGRAGGLIVDVIKRKGWFSTVVSPEDVAGVMENNGKLKRAVTDYLSKLKEVHFSDPDISRYIGKTVHVDALLVVEVDFWHYTVQGDDKLAKVGFSMNLVEASTGKIMWKANHSDTKSYTWFKPDLVGFARGVAKDMISYMPH